MIPPSNRAQKSGIIDKAVAAFHSGQYAKAEKLGRQAIKKSPSNPDLMIMVAICCDTQGKLGFAGQFLEKALKLHSDHPVALTQLGLIKLKQGHFAEARDTLVRALAVDPNSLEVLIALGDAEGQLKNVDTAHAYLKRAIPLASEDAGSLRTISIFLRRSGFYNDAVDILSDAIVKWPDDADLHGDISLALRDRGDLEEALATVEKAIEIEPSEARFYLNQSILLRSLCRFEDAVTAAKRAVELEPDEAEHTYQLAIDLLTLGRFDEGWPYFETRWDTFPKHMVYPLDGKKWTGEPLRGARLLVRNEQAIGEEILFSTCFPDLIKAAGDGEVTIECDPRMTPLFARTFPELDFVDVIRPRSDSPRPRGYDVEIAAGSLLPLFRPDVGSIEKAVHRPLVPRQEMVDQWQSRFGDLPGIKVGIAWRGGAKPLSKIARSTTLDEFLPILKTDGCSFVNLQYGDTADEIAALRKSHGITVHDWDDVDPLKDMEGQVAQIAALDMVVQISNTSAHVAGSLGVPAWILQAAVPYWPWFLARDDMPWYTNVTQFRVGQDMNKTRVIKQMAEQLAAHIAKGRNGG